MRYLGCFLLLLSLNGCAYLDAQGRLVEQARKGVALAAADQAGHAALIEQLQTLRRKALDEGFDADVRQQTTLSADWVIEHRRMYGAGLEALNTWHASATAADRAAAANLKAVDAALERLGWLQAVAAGWMERKP
jgi:hypothetical protein